MCHFIGFRLVYNLLGIDIDKEKSATIRETGRVPISSEVIVFVFVLFLFVFKFGN